MEEEYLAGHSGCNVIKTYKNGVAFVRKKSTDVDYNDRLKAQMNKQQMYYMDGCLCPKILDSGYDEQNSFFFDMEYIDGPSLSEVISNTNALSMKKLVDLVFSILVENKNKVEEVTNIQSLFVNKIHDINSKLPKEVQDSFLIKKAVSYLLKYDWNNCEATACHGDFTLENIIFHNDKIYLIDFLDSFYNSWKIDAAKILQDVYCLWSYREEKNISPDCFVKIATFYYLFIDKINSFDSSALNDIFALLLLNLLRILQYNSNKKTEMLVYEQIKRVMDLLEEQK